MEKRINWLHFTDLHYGQKKQDILLPKIKKELFRDIEYIKEQIGKIDIVFFTGDLTQSGGKEEFDELTAFLKELWSHFNKLSSNPFLIAIPGNHDLNRPDPTRAVVKVLRNYHLDLELQEGLWEGLAMKSEYYEVIRQSFANFNNWYKEISVPKPNFIEGLVPGDIATEIKINDILLRIVGLNTAFLELSSDDCRGKLAIHPAQLIKMVGANPLEWIERADISLFLTHHDPQWYDKKSNDYYNNDINPGSSFYSHFCGHLHEANTFQYSLVGSPLRKTQLAPSLFGLQKINNHLDRIHGYYAGSYVVQDNNIKELFYPRRANLRYDGNYGIDADNGFHLGKMGFLEFNRLLSNDDDFENRSVLDELKTDSSKEAGEINENLENKNILDLNITPESAKELEKTPKISYTPQSQHQRIRIIEQNNFIELIRKNRLAWLITDWGLDESGFIGSVAGHLQLGNTRSSFILNCEDIASDEELITAFTEQFGMTLQNFCNLVTKIDNSLFVLDHVNVSLYTNSNYNRLLEILKSILDYCPKINMIVVARQSPALLPSDKYIRLAPLDAAQVKSYVENHPNVTQELGNPDNLLKLIEITSGVPMHIDRIIDGLKVAAFEELIEAEREVPIEVISDIQIPKSLRQAISVLSDTTDRSKLRSFKLLKILTVLANGETFSNITRFDSNEPIYLNNATELERLALLEVINSPKGLSTIAGNSSYQIKILRVPRQIRDYVNTLITESEKDDILRFASDMYFGKKWREGYIKQFSSSSFFGTKRFLNVDNCHLIINSLMATAIKNNNDAAIERAAMIGVNFGKHVFDVADYKNSIRVTEEIYNWLKSTNHQRLKATVSKILGEGLRMTGSHEKSNLMLNEALSTENGQLSNIEKNAIYIDLGYTYIKQVRYDKAIECARAVEKTAGTKNAHSIQAKYILAQATLKGDELLTRIRSLESDAKRADIPNLCNTLSLHIAELNQDPKEREKRFNKILMANDDNYNRVRAIIKKSLDILSNDEGTLAPEDLLLLNVSYSYLYPQRLESLFTSCHKALWLYCIKEGLLPDLLNLFKHSSLVWRISGENEIEKSYFAKLEAAVADKLDSIGDSKNDLNLDYYNRRKLEFNAQAVSSLLQLLPE